MPTALTRFCINYLPQPVSRSIIDGLSYVESEIESAVIGSPENHNYFMLLMLHFGDSQVRVLLLQVVGTNQTGLVP